MSRSNPQENGMPNPAVRWFEWNAEHGHIRYWDKEKKEMVKVGDQFTFILLDQLSSVRGWDEAENCGIYSNEVKDTRQDVMLVKSHKGGLVAEGLYKNIKKDVNAAGADYNANLYIAFKDDTTLKMGSLRFKGVALKAWMDFVKKYRAELYKQAVIIDGSTTGTKGKVTFKTPKFALKVIAEPTQIAATALDIELQEYLRSYLSRTKRDQVEHVRDEDMPSSPPPRSAPKDLAIEADDIPF